jgi:hypothetical protein
MPKHPMDCLTREDIEHAHETATALYEESIVNEDLDLCEVIMTSIGYVEVEVDLNGHAFSIVGFGECLTFDLDNPEYDDGDDDDDDYDRREAAMLAGMAGGCEAYNDAMGYSVEYPEED